MLLKDIYVNQIIGFTNKNGAIVLGKVVEYDDEPEYIVLHLLNEPNKIFKKAINNLLGLM